VQPGAVFPLAQLLRRQLDAHDAAQVAHLVAVGLVVVVADGAGGLAALAVAGQAVGLDPDGGGVVVEAAVVLAPDFHQPVGGLGIGAEPGDGRHLVGVGLVLRIARPVGDVVEKEAAVAPFLEVGGDAGEGVGRQEAHGVGVDGQAAGHELLVVHPARGHQHAADVLGVPGQLVADAGLDAAVADGEVGRHDAQDDGGGEQPDFVLEAHGRVRWRRQVAPSHWQSGIYANSMACPSPGILSPFLIQSAFRRRKKKPLGSGFFRVTARGRPGPGAAQVGRPWRACSAATRSMPLRRAIRV